MEQTLQSKRGWVAVNRIKVRSPFKDLFVIDEKTLKSIAEHMQANGYDEAQPIVVWDRTEAEQNKHALYVLDGHTRLQAAKSIHLSPVYIARMKFPSEDEALQYAIHNQRDRRNLSDGDLLRCIEAVDQTKQRGGDRKSEKSKASSDAIDKGKSSEETARIVGASARKVEKARTVRQHADEETKGAVLDGKKSIHQAYVETQEKRSEESGRPPKHKESEKLFNLKRWWRLASKRDRKTFLTFTVGETAANKSKLPESIERIFDTSGAFQFSHIAISQLSRIRLDDPRREEAFDEVENWIRGQPLTKEKRRKAEVYPPFESLMRSWNLVLKETISFHQNYTAEKGGLKEYLEKISQAIGNLETLVGGWQKKL